MPISRTAVIALLLPVILGLSTMPLATPTTAAGIPTQAAPPDPRGTLPASGTSELHRREAVQASLGPALRAAAKDERSAGAYFDDTDTAVFLTSGDPAKVRGKLTSLIPGNVQSRFEHVRHSLKELYALQGRVNADLSAGRLRELGISSTAIDTRANAVVVGASRVTDELRATLADAYGNWIVATFEPPSEGGDACTSRSNCPPAKGGIKIDAPNGGYCTSGPMVRVAGSNQLRILTAGHCIAVTGGTGTNKKWTHHDAALGWSEAHSWVNGADADAGLIYPSPTVTGSRNLMYRASSTDVVGITAWKQTVEQVQGSLLCRSGAKSGYRCGEIALTNKTKDVDGVSIDHQWVVDFDACPGDSGAPYLVGNVAWGIHSDSTAGCDPTTNQAWYSPMGWVFDTLAAQGHPIELCTDPLCSAGTNAWTPKGSLDGTAWNPRLVTLDDGRVLRIGGDDGTLTLGSGASGPAPATEIFNPATGAWSDTSPPPWLPNRCAGQFAVLLPDGSVLVGGGASMDAPESDPCAATAFIFDPSSGPNGSWAGAEAMPQTIVSAGAVLLDDGRVFVTGGTGADGATSLALAYNPQNGHWTTLPPAPASAGAFAPLVLRLDDGRVLVSGGFTVSDPSGPKYVDNPATHLFDPSGDTWTASTTNVGARGMAGVVLGNGRVVVAGGQHLTWNGGQQFSFVTNVRMLNPATGAWTTLAPLRTGRAGFTLAELANGQLLVAAGDIPSGTIPSGAPSKTADVYDWTTNAWYAAASLGAVRADHGSAVLGNGSVLVAGGGTTTSEAYKPGDVTPPVMATPLARFRPGATMSSTSLPAVVTWTAGTDSGGSGVGTYDISRSTDGGAYSTLASTLTTLAYTTSLTPGRTYTFRVRARDWAGNVGPWKVAATVKAAITQQTSSAVTYTGTWTTGNTTKYSGDTVKYATAAGASATYTFTGRSVAWVTTRAARSGSAKIYVDGVLEKTMSLNLSSYVYRYVAFQKSWTSSGAHSIKIVVVGTSGHPRIDIDAFLVLRNP